MSTPKKKVVKTTKRVAKNTTNITNAASNQLIFGRENYKFILIAVALIIFGMILMSGGSMPSADVWDDSIIYSFRRITLAPMVILAGLGVGVYAIFK